MSETKNFSDVVSELLPLAEEVVEAVIEPILHPHSAVPSPQPSALDGVKAHVAKMFEQARLAGPTSLVPKKVAHEERSAFSRAATAPEKRRTLVEQAAPIIQRASATVSTKPVVMPHTREAYVISPIRASYAELVKAALEAIERDLPKDERHDIKEAS